MSYSSFIPPLQTNQRRNRKVYGKVAGEAVIVFNTEIELLLTTISQIPFVKPSNKPLHNCVEYQQNCSTFPSQTLSGMLRIKL